MGDLMIYVTLTSKNVRHSTASQDGDDVSFAAALWCKTNASFPSLGKPPTYGTD